jgi:hypothetical protein
MVTDCVSSTLVRAESTLLGACLARDRSWSRLASRTGCEDEP